MRPIDKKFVEVKDKLYEARRKVSILEKDLVEIEEEIQTAEMIHELCCVCHGGGEKYTPGMGWSECYHCYGTGKEYDWSTYRRNRKERDPNES